MARLFGESGRGRLVILAMDHDIALGAVPGLDSPRTLLQSLHGSGIDGTLLCLGTAGQTSDLFAVRDAPARILTVDLPLHSNIPGNVEDFKAYDMIASVEDAVRLGVECVKAMIIWGVDHALEMRMLAKVANLRQACAAWDMPLMIETVLWGAAIPESDRADGKLIANACRICAELGADIIKAPFVSDVDALHSIVVHTPVPVVILGGPKAACARDVLEKAAQAMSAGVAGIVFGRNVWQYDDPPRISAALGHIVHNNMSVDEAMQTVGTTPWS